MIRGWEKKRKDDNIFVQKVTDYDSRKVEKEIIKLSKKVVIPKNTYT